MFYGAGVWMLAVAAIFPQFEVTRVSGFAIFGVLFLGYSLLAYVVLGRPNGGAAST